MAHRTIVRRGAGLVVHPTVGGTMTFIRGLTRCTACTAATLLIVLGITIPSSVMAATTDGSGADVAQGANPFADVPPNHWAYDAVRHRAADDVLRGGGPDRSRRPQHRGEARPNAASRAARHRRGPRLDQRVPARAR